jgi:acylphosphatase
MPAIRIIVEGSVQGVGFRAFVCRRAALFGVSGRVWNRSDGNVEAFAVFPEPGPLEVFAGSLESGPGKVKNVRTEPAPEPDIEPLGFSIAPTV